MQCVSDKSNYAATDEWCANNYKISNLCTGSGCKLVATEAQKNDQSLTIGKMILKFLNVEEDLDILIFCYLN